MKIPEQHILDLLHRYATRQASEAELRELTDWWADGSQEDQSIFHRFMMEWTAAQATTDVPGLADPDQIFAALRQGRPLLQEEEANPAPVKRLWLRWVAAAAVLILLTVGGWYWFTGQSGKPDGTTPPVIAVIGPGKQGALLTLADGSRVLLDTIQNGVVALQGGVTARVVDGSLQYDGHAQETVYNTMSTPKGRQFQLVLPDGSRVWLNAASMIRYPTAFAANDRRVEITGEAYFEVVKDKKPFIVRADNRATVTVLGTHFNVNSYDNEPALNTTLLEGSVRVEQGSEQVVIAPGEQANVTDKLTVRKAIDIDQVMAWKNGVFNFENMKLEVVMRQLERWYDIDVVYEGAVPDIVFEGKISRGMSLQDLLETLNLSNVKYRLEACRKLVVLP